MCIYAQVVKARVSICPWSCSFSPMPSADAGNQTPIPYKGIHSLSLSHPSNF